MTPSQQKALDKYLPLFKSGKSEAKGVQIVESELRNVIFVAFHVGADEEPKWFDHHYQLEIHSRGRTYLITDISGSFKDYKGKKWCGITVR